MSRLSATIQVKPAAARPTRTRAGIEVRVVVTNNMKPRPIRGVIVVLLGNPRDDHTPEPPEPPKPEPPLISPQTAYDMRLAVVIGSCLSLTIFVARALVRALVHHEYHLA